MKRIIYLIIEIALVAICAFFMITNLTPHGEQQATVSQAADQIQWVGETEAHRGFI